MCSTALPLMLLQWGATACPAAVGKHGMRSFVLLQAHFCGVGNAVMCELPGEERAHGWKNTAAPARELAEKKRPCSFTGQVHRPALVPIRKKALCKCHSPLGWCQPILSPRPQHIWAHLLPWALQGAVSSVVALLALGSQCNPGFSNGNLS